MSYYKASYSLFHAKFATSIMKKNNFMKGENIMVTCILAISLSLLIGGIVGTAFGKKQLWNMMLENKEIRDMCEKMANRP